MRFARLKPQKRKIIDGVWYKVPRKVKLICCDCALVHSVEHRVNKNGILEYRVFRDNRSTAARRRERK